MIVDAVVAAAVAAVAEAVDAAAAGPRVSTAFAEILEPSTGRRESTPTLRWSTLTTASCTTTSTAAWTESTDRRSTSDASPTPDDDGRLRTFSRRTEPGLDEAADLAAAAAAVGAPACWAS